MNKKSHILFIQPELEGVGGVQKVVPVIAKEFKTLGYEVSAFTAYGDIPDFGINWSFKKSLHEKLNSNIFHKIYKIIKRGKELVKVVLDYKPDILIVSTTGVSVLVLFFKRLRIIKTPVLIYVHESIFLSNKWQRFLINKLYPTADGIICVSLGIKNEMKEQLGVSENRLALAYNSLPKTNVAQVEGEEMHKLNQEPLFVTASRLEKVKGVDILVDFFIRFLAENEGRLLILGTGSLAELLQEKVKSAGFEKRIIFAGYETNVHQRLVNAKAYVSCARSESFGMSLVEALASGVPIVACDVPYGPREVMGEFDLGKVSYPYRASCGYLIGSPRDYTDKELYQQFKEALQLVQEKPFDSKELKNRASKFNVKDQVEVIEKMINQCLT